MSKPKDGYQRKSIDLKKVTIKKISKIAIDKSVTPKEYIEQVIERHSQHLKP